MVKEQGLALNQSKLAGQCGRLKCCMRYEYQTYLELKRGLPAPGSHDPGETLNFFSSTRQNLLECLCASLPRDQIPTGHR